jgi:hypothetical protein
LAALFEGEHPISRYCRWQLQKKGPKRVLTLSELAEQFRELERLREKVRALEQSASDRTAFGRTGRTAQSDAK